MKTRFFFSKKIWLFYLSVAAALLFVYVPGTISHVDFCMDCWTRGNLGCDCYKVCPVIELLRFTDPCTLADCPVNMGELLSVVNPCTLYNDCEFDQCYLIDEGGDISKLLECVDPCDLCECGIDDICDYLEDNEDCDADGHTNSYECSESMDPCE